MFVVKETQMIYLVRGEVYHTPKWEVNYQSGSCMLSPPERLLFHFSWRCARGKHRRPRQFSGCGLPKGANAHYSKSTFLTRKSATRYTRPLARALFALIHGPKIRVWQFMIIIMKHNASEAELNHVVEVIEKQGYKAHLIRGVERTVVGAVGDERGKARLESLRTLSGVENVVPILKPFKLVGRQLKEENTCISISGLVIGGKEFHVMAGPCSVESREQILESAEIIKRGGAKILRGGAFKPRTSPYSFQGLERKGLEMLAEARERTGLLIVTEVMDPHNVKLVAEYADILQVGARNMQNFALLKSLGKIDKPILLKRGMMSTIEEFLMSAEYILSEGNYKVILCERGIRTFETATRSTLDLTSIPIIKKLSHLPIVVDPSHATGRWDMVLPMSKASVAAGADGLMIEVHPRPEEAYSDGFQSLMPERYYSLMKEIQPLVSAMNRVMG